MSKRILSLVLAVVMVMLAVPAIVLPTFAADVPEAGFKTTFSDAEDILPEYQANKANYTTGSIFAFPENWAIGGMSAATWDGNYTVTNTVKNGGEYLNNGTSGWMEGSNGGGWYFASGQLVAAATYIGETEDLNGDGNVDANDRTFKSVDRNIAVRYTAPYFGTVTIDVTKLVFNYTWNAVFAILLNGEPIGQFDTEEFDYATGAGWYVPTATDSTDAIESIVKIDVEKGDKIDFVFRLTGLDATDIGTTFNYAQGKRPANDWGFSVEYEAGYAKVKDMNAWETEKSFDVAYVPGETKYFFTWFDGGVAKASGDNLSADAVAKINPALIKNGIIKETDTLADAWAKWVAYMKEATKITYNSNWSFGDMTGGVYSPITTAGYISGVSSFALQGTAAAGNYKVRSWDNQFWITAAGADKQYESAYKFIKDHSDLTDATIVTDIAVPASDEVSNNTYSFAQMPVGSTSVCSHVSNLSAPLYVRPTNQKSGSVAAITWTAPTAGYAKIQISDLSYSENTATDFAVMLNGSVLIDYTNIDLTADPVAAINALLADVEFPVAKGDQVSLAFARPANNSGVRVKLSAKATLDTSRIPPVTEVWTAAVPELDINNTKGTYFFAWYEGNTQVNSGSLSNNASLKINPYLVDNNIISATDTVATAFAKWKAYMKETTKITYTNGWSLGSYNKGVYTEILYHGYLSDRSAFNLDGTSGSYKYSGWDTQYWIPEAGVDAQFDFMYNSILKLISADTKVNTIDMKPVDAMSRAIASNKITPSTSTGYAHGGKNGNGRTQPFWLRPAANANAGAVGAYTWTASKAGVVTFKINSFSYEDNTKADVAVLWNGKVVSDFTTIDLSAADALAQLNAKIAGMEFPVAEGDQVMLLFARVNGAAARVNLAITAELDQNRVPVIYKDGGVAIQSYAVAKGDALPELANQPSFGLMGYLVNGEYTTKLPATVDEALVIENYAIESAASITITGKYTINVYVAGGEGATGAGVIVGGKMIDGVLQANGYYKVAVMDVYAGQLRKATLSYIPYQVYGDEYRIGISEVTVSAMDLLKAYSTGDYDTTTKALASSVLDLVETLRAYLEYPVGGDINSTVKSHLKGAQTISGNYLSGVNDIYLGTLKYISTGEVPKYIANFKDAVFVPDASLSAADKVEMGYADGVNPASSAYKYAIKAVTLNFEERIGFAFRVVANGQNSVSDLRAGGKYAIQVFDGVSYAYYDAFLYEGAEKNAKAIVVDGVPASRYMRDYEFTIVEANGDGTYTAVGATLTYSVKAYAVQTFTFGDASFKSYLAQALFRLGVVADEYVAAHPVA